MTGWGMSSRSHTLNQHEAAIISVLRAGIPPQDLDQYLWVPRKTIQRTLSRMAAPTELRQAWLDGGPIVSERTQLLQPVRCHCCRERIDLVPCVACSPAEEDTEEEGTIELPECPQPTEARPGTLEKILVMRERLEAGYSVFCEGDAVWQRAS